MPTPERTQVESDETLSLAVTLANAIGDDSERAPAPDGRERLWVELRRESSVGLAAVDLVVAVPELRTTALAVPAWSRLTANPLTWTVHNAGQAAADAHLDARIVSDAGSIVWAESSVEALPALAPATLANSGPPRLEGDVTAIRLYCAWSRLEIYMYIHMRGAHACHIHSGRAPRTSVTSPHMASQANLTHCAVGAQPPWQSKPA